MCPGGLARTILAGSLALALLAPGARAEEADAAAPDATQTEAEPAQQQERHGIAHRLLFYLPNRVFDLLDVVRARVRVGPGLAVGARATELADVNLGAYTTLYAGLPGPRGKPRISLPVGLEVYAGAEVSVLDASTEESRFSPSYGPAEVGLGFQAAILGLDLGVEPWDLLDLALGLVLLDPNGDDF